MDWFHPRDLLIVPLAYTVLGAVLFAIQDRLIFHPGTTPFGSCNALAEATLIEREGLRAYLIPHEGPRLAVVYHGNAGTACNRAHYASLLKRAGYATLLVEYPGFAGDTRSPSIERTLQAVDRVVATLPELGYTEIAVIGESIGSGPASYHASRAATEALVLITPFDRLSAVVQEALPLYPARLLLRRDLPVVTWAQSAPRVLIVRAQEDEVIAPRRTDALVAALGTAATVVSIPGRGHNDLHDDPRFASAIVDFLTERP